MKTLRNYGKKNIIIKKYKGINSKLDKMQAAILRVKRMSKDYKDYYSWNRVAGDMIEVVKKTNKK